jgi:hypothetical protein
MTSVSMVGIPLKLGYGCKKIMRFTIVLIAIVTEVVVQHQILDTLLLFALSLLLGFHGDCEMGVRRQINRSGLQSCQ